MNKNNGHSDLMSTIIPSTTAPAQEDEVEPTTVARVMASACLFSILAGVMALTAAGAVLAFKVLWWAITT